MDRKKFLKNLSLGVVFTPIIASGVGCTDNTQTTTDPNACDTSPKETLGPFPLKSPMDFVRANIVGDRNGVPLMVNLVIQDVNASCQALSDVYVDIWQCDAKGNYSEYSGQLDGNFTNEHFLRGRQLTNKDGQVSFITIYPGWYPGRAPHIHVEILNKNEKSLLVTQIAFPEETSKDVYTSEQYNGDFDTSNEEDNIFNDSILGNMSDSLVGNNQEGYTLTKIIKVKS